MNKCCDPCQPNVINSKNVIYTGPFLPNTGIQTGTNLTTSLIYIDKVIGDITASADKNFIFDQPTVSSTWNIIHTLNKLPSVATVDSAGTLIIGQVDYIDNSNLIVRFNSPTSGKAILN